MANLRQLSPSEQVDREIKYFPKTVRAYRRACDRIVQQRLASGKQYKRQFKTGEELFEWWISRK